MENEKPKITVKKESQFKKFIKSFIVTDAETFKEKMLYDVIKPKLLSGVNESIKSAADILTSGSYQPQKKPSTGLSTYTFTNTRDRLNGTVSTKPMPSVSTKTVQEIWVDDEAYVVNRFEEMQSRLRNSGYVTLAYYYDIFEQKPSYNDNEYGWKDLSAAKIEHTTDGWRIALPRPQYLLR